MWMTALLLSPIGTGDAAAKEYALDPRASAISLDDQVEIVPQWIDVSGADYVISVDLKNNGEIPIVIRSEGIRCVRGSYEGKATYGASFGIGERSIDLVPGEVKTVKLLCDHGGGITGDFALKIARVDEDLGQGTRTVVEIDDHELDVGVELPGDALFTNVVWRLAEPDIEKKRQKAGQQLATGSYDRPVRSEPADEVEPMEEPPPPPASVITVPG